MIDYLSVYIYSGLEDRLSICIYIYSGLEDRFSICIYIFKVRGQIFHLYLYICIQGYRIDYLSVYRYIYIYSGLEDRLSICIMGFTGFYMLFFCRGFKLVTKLD